ncbi:MAG: prephenate dehydrogenase/arogenate dehydrogenase family protein [Clostridia bacterium]|nr:prephenate dehydrogenase/arogenate dehydrogenase family protein [Clostridia bacterium]
MKICVAGLGIIGGSVCLALKRAGYRVAGWNRSKQPLDYALKNGVIDEAAQSFTDYDVVYVALPPKATVEFINNNAFKDGAIVSDICGVKEPIEKAVYKQKRNFRYVGCHPMAGKEVSGVQNASATLFDGANIILTRCDKTDAAAFEEMCTLAEDMGFKYLIECSAGTHDEKIAYTSQLAHVVSNAYVKDGEIESCIGFTGGSFQDMTRIAGVDENVWASLYLENANNLSEKIGSLISSLTEIKQALDEGNAEKLTAVLKDGRQRFESGKNFQPRPDIFVRKLK